MQRKLVLVILLVLAACTQRMRETDPPTVMWQSPAAGSVVEDSVRLTVNATDESGIERVAFFANDTLIGEDSSGAGNTFSVVWDSSAFVDSSVTLTARATDGVGNTGAASITVRTGNFPFRSDPTVTLSGNTVTVAQILHAADQEAGLAALDDAPRFSSVINALRPQYPITLTLMSGDIYIPGPFFSATGGRSDIRIMNAVGTQASVFGNHEFDLGTAVIADLIAPATGYAGTRFPLLSANLDFRASNLARFVVPGGQEAATIPNSIAPSTVITVEGERFGIVGITTPLLPSISSPGAVTVFPPDPEDMVALAAHVQPTIDALTATGIDKIIVLAHMQQLRYEIELAGLLRDVDIIIGGGSDTLLASDDDRLRPGKARGGQYPLLFRSPTSDPVAIVNTDREYRYVGRLVVGFDENGILSEILPDSGAYATDVQGVQETGNVAPHPDVVAAVTAVRDVIIALDGQIFGSTTVYLNGLRDEVRSQETNLGNLTTDADLTAAQALDPSVRVAIKNGGGIRDSIGAIEPGPEARRVPPFANPLTGKQAGEISQLDIGNALRFNNSSSLLSVTAAELKVLLEHGVARWAVGATPGQFPQVAGMRFSFDPARTAQVVQTGVVTTPGERVRSLAIVDAAGNVSDVIVQNGVVVGDPERLIRLVTPTFLADGGDSYPFPARDRVDTALSEQTSLQQFLLANSPITLPDTPPSGDVRIQNLRFRADTVIP